MGIKVANNAFGTLASGITNSATSLTLTTGQGARFPTLGAGDYFYATLIDTTNNLEIVKCTARSTDVLTIVRAQENTTARAYSAGDRVEIRITAATFDDATGIADGEVTAAKLASTAITDKLGYTPANKAGDTFTGQVVSNVLGYTASTNYGGAYRIVQGDGTATQWAAISLPDTLAGTSNSNNYWFMGRGNSISERRWTHHIPSYADYGSTGVVPSWQVCYTGDIPILKASADGTVYAKGGIYRPDVNGMVVGAAPNNNGYGLWFDTDSNTAYGSTTYFTAGGYYSGDINQMGFIGGSVPRWSVSLNSGEIMHWYQRCAFDRAWDNYPSISVKNDGTYGSQAEFRIHGIGGASGGDFSVVTRCDGGYVSGSDARRKTNVEPIQNALQTVTQLQGKKFNIINRNGDIDPMRGDKKQYGFIAQDCIDVIPEAVTYYPEADEPNEKGWASAYSIDYQSLVPMLVEAIKEQQTQIETLKAEVAALKAGA